MNSKNDAKKLLMISVLLVLLALASITAATMAWMSIADRTRVRSMRMEIISDSNLRFDLDPHDTFEEYVKTLSFRDITQRILQDRGYDPVENPLTPVTTEDCLNFTLEDGSKAKPEYYLEFTLHFISERDIFVHLSNAGEDGTSIISSTDGVPEALRMSFLSDNLCVYDPGLGDTRYTDYDGKVFGLPGNPTDVYNDNSTLFSLQAGVDKPVVIRIWLEGTDEACTDDLRNADYSIRLRFVGTDEFGTPLGVPQSNGNSQ